MRGSSRRPSGSIRVGDMYTTFPAYGGAWDGSAEKTGPGTARWSGRGRQSGSAWYAWYFPPGLKRLKSGPSIELRTPQPAAHLEAEHAVTLEPKLLLVSNFSKKKTNS